ncbi:MAG: PqqD family protein [Bacteroidaceae bacterium]|nr:PqqD family protein [Bacteroidaceae bacterium]MBR6600585.1 PqqD family protein [Bacteroidaceae bacterium]
MKINEGFELREMCGEHIIIATGVANIDFSKVISLNESAAYLWREVEGKEFTPATMAALLTEKYDIDEATALADATALAQRWAEAGIAQ